jgi:hypothetical protein
VLSSHLGTIKKKSIIVFIKSIFCPCLQRSFLRGHGNMSGCMAALPPAGSKAGLTAGSKAGLTLPQLVSDTKDILSRVYSQPAPRTEGIELPHENANFIEFPESEFHGSKSAFHRRRADDESIQNKARKFLLRGECIISLILMRIPRILLYERF